MKEEKYLLEEPFSKIHLFLNDIVLARDEVTITQRMGLSKFKLSHNLEVI